MEYLSVQNEFNKKGQALLIEAINEAAEYQNNLVKKHEEDYVKALKASGVEFIEVDKNAFEELSIKKLPELFKDVAGMSQAPDIYQRIRDVI